MYVNMVLEDVIEYEITPEGKQVGQVGQWSGMHLLPSQECPYKGDCNPRPSCPFPQETRLSQILLNGNNIALLVPGGKPEGVV